MPCGVSRIPDCKQRYAYSALLLDIYMIVSAILKIWQRAYLIDVGAVQQPFQNQLQGIR